MSDPVPRTLEGLLQLGRVAYVALEAAGGVHVTAALYSWADGRLWFVAAADTRKVRLLQRSPAAGVLVEAGTRRLLLAGEAGVVDAARPLTLVATTSTRRGPSSGASSSWAPSRPAGGDLGARVRLRLCAGQPRRGTGLARAGERARRIEIGYFLTRSGRGDEVHYRSTLRDVFTLGTGGTRTTLVGSAADDAFAYRRPRRGAPPAWSRSAPANGCTPSASPV